MADKSRQSANLVSDTNIFSNPTTDKVGIGTTNATSKLTVAGDVSVSGVLTATSYGGTIANATYAEYATTAGIATFATSAGVSTSVISGIASVTRLQVVGVATFTGGPVLIGSGTSTGTASQRLQVTGGAYVSGNVGIGTTNPTQPFQIGTGSTIVVVDNLGELGIGTNNPVGKFQVGAGTSTFIITGIGSVGIGTTNPSNALTVVGTTDIQGAVETVSVASTYNLNGGKYLLECNAQSGTVFTHTVPTAGNIGIVSFKNFPATKNSVTTFTIFITQNSAGTGNTTAVTGIGTNIRLLPTGATAGLTTSARVSTASTITLPTTGLDVDIVTFAVHYNGAGAATTTNYTVYATDTSSFRFGSIRP